MGKEKMFCYNAKQNNCQVFIRNLLEASGMYDNEIFIMQDINQLFHGFTGTWKIMNTVTAIGNRLNMLSEGTIKTWTKINYINKFGYLFNMYQIKIKISRGIHER